MLSSRIELRIEIWNCNDKYQRLVNDEREVTRVELKTFTRFTFKLVFRLSGRSVPWDKPPASKHTGVHNLHIPVTAYWSVNKWYINISWFRFILQIYFSEWVLIFLKKKPYGPFLWMGFNYLKATEPQRGDNLLFTFKLPSMIIKFPKDTSY